MVVLRNFLAQQIPQAGDQGEIDEYLCETSEPGIQERERLHQEKINQDSSFKRAVPSNIAEILLP